MSYPEPSSQLAKWVHLKIALENCSNVVSSLPLPDSKKGLFFRIVLSVLGNAKDGKLLDVAARNFTFGEVATVMQLAARFSRD